MPVFALTPPLPPTFTTNGVATPLHLNPHVCLRASLPTSSAFAAFCLVRRAYVGASPLRSLAMERLPPFVGSRARASWHPSCLVACGARQPCFLELRQHEPVLAQVGEARAWAFTTHGHGWVPSVLLSEFSDDIVRIRDEMSRSVSGTVVVVDAHDINTVVGTPAWSAALSSWTPNVRCQSVLQLGYLAVVPGDRLFVRRGLSWS